MQTLESTHLKCSLHIIRKLKRFYENRKSQIKSIFQVGIICLIITFSLLLIASRSSPLYAFNDWADANTFFTLGKGMMREKVLYRDLFDHKGPFLYFIYGMAYLLSHKDFLGVFFLESVSFSIFLFLSEKVFELFLDRRFSLLTLVLFGACILNLRSFAYGGSAEFFTFPFLMAGIYFFVRYFKKIFPKPMPIKWGFWNGLIAGCFLWIKYSFLEYWVGWMAILIILALVKGQFSQILKFCALFMAGILTATLPWMLYFGIQHALPDWFHAYFTINLTAYTKDLSISEILHTAIDSYQRQLQFNPLAIGLMTLGVLIFVTLNTQIKSSWFSLGLILSIGILALGVYAGGRDYIYYFLIFAPFVILGFIYLARTFQENLGAIKPNLLFSFLLIAALILSFAYTLRFNRNKAFRKVNPEDLAQFRFAEIISQMENPSLLNYGFQDSGFYTTTGIVPNVKYLERYNFEYGEFPINMDEQNRYIQEQLVEYVVVRLSEGLPPTLINLDSLDENYQQIASHSQNFGEQGFNYQLYQRR